MKSKFLYIAYNIMHSTNIKHASVILRKCTLGQQQCQVTCLYQQKKKISPF